ncbi:hypothetical protein ACLOJK_029060 [Asimina triloba]
MAGDKSPLTREKNPSLYLPLVFNKIRPKLTAKPSGVHGCHLLQRPRAEDDATRCHYDGIKSDHCSTSARPTQIWHHPSAKTHQIRFCLH